MGTEANGGMSFGFSSSGWTCGNCETYVPPGVSHHCSGWKVGNGAAWSLMPDWTTIYLGQIVGLLSQIEDHLRPQMITVELAETQDEDLARRIADQVAVWTWSRRRQGDARASLDRLMKETQEAREKLVERLTEGEEAAQTLRRAGVDPEERWEREQEDKGNGNG